MSEVAPAFEGAFVEPMSSINFQAERACDACGAFGGYVFEDEAVCLSCYQARGSCGAEREEPADDDSAASREPLGAPECTGKTRDTVDDRRPCTP